MNNLAKTKLRLYIPDVKEEEKYLV